jgi:hypothetical protein
MQNMLVLWVSAAIQLRGLDFANSLVNATFLFGKVVAFVDNK